MKRRDLLKSLRMVVGGSLCSGSDFFGDCLPEEELQKIWDKLKIGDETLVDGIVQFLQNPPRLNGPTYGPMPLPYGPMPPIPIVP
jgi:hypothetical protein